MAKDLDLITVGRISVDLFAEQINTSFSQPQTFHKSIGGSPTNVAVAAARLGHKSAIVTKVGVDPLGQYVVNKLKEFGVNTDFVKVAESGLTEVNDTANFYCSSVSAPTGLAVNNAEYLSVALTIYQITRL